MIIVKNLSHLIIPAVKSTIAGIFLMPLLYVVGFLLIPTKLTIGWYGSNWCNTYAFDARQIQRYLLFEGFWMGLCLSLFVLFIFLLSYKFGKKLERKWRFLLAISFSLIFLFIGCTIANASNINLVDAINSPNSCRD